MINHWIFWRPELDMARRFIVCLVFFNLCLQNSVTHAAQVGPQRTELICEAIPVRFPDCDDSGGAFTFLSNLANEYPCLD